MGLLDDAIREHLELKRRRGAPTEEIARQEQEAFGAPRHGDFEAAPAAVAEAIDEPAEAYAAEPEAVAPEVLPPTQLHVVEDDHAVEEIEPPRPHGDPADDLPHADPAPHLHEHEEQHEPPRPHGDPADALVQHADPAPAPAAPVEPSHAQPTREFDVEELREAAGEDAATAGDEEGDVLEETPEFLQETPEHDRLWFEQRPPRDFDF